MASKEPKDAQKSPSTTGSKPKTSELLSVLPSSSTSVSNPSADVIPEAKKRAIMREEECKCETAMVSVSCKRIELGCGNM